MEIGANLTADAGIQKTKSCKKRVGFIVEINPYDKPAGKEAVKSTTFVRCLIDTKPVKKLLKGVHVQLNGQLEVKAFSNKSDEPSGILDLSGIKIDSKAAMASPVTAVLLSSHAEPDKVTRLIGPTLQ